MRKDLLSLAFISYSFIAGAQITIDENDMPVVGEPYGVVQTAGIEIEDPAGLAGEDVFWDYSDLNEGLAETETYLSVSDVPIQFQFVFNNPFSESYSNLALPVANFTDGLGIPVSDAHNFFRADEDGYFDCGYAASFSELPIFGERNPTDRILKFPLEYGMAPDANDSFFEINIPQFANYKSYQTRENSVDGWGVVETPAGVYDALRVRSVVNGIDSIYSETLQIDQAIVQPETIEYRWLAPEQGLPVLQINTVDGMVTQVRYQTDEVDTAIPEFVAEEIAVFPNPAIEQFNAVIPTSVYAERVVLVDLNGRLIDVDYTQTGNEVQVNSSNVNAGLYRVFIYSEKRNWGGWVVIR